MVFDAVSMDEKMDSSSESSGFASAVSIMNRDSVTPVSLQTSLKMGAVGATRSRVAACVFSGRGGGAFLSVGVLVVAAAVSMDEWIHSFLTKREACSQCCDGVVQRLALQHWIRYSRYGRWQTDLERCFGIAV